jgi:hypothetical protein
VKLGYYSCNKKAKYELNSKSIGINEERFYEESKQKIRIERYGINKHYNTIIGDSSREPNTILKQN